MFCLRLALSLQKTLYYCNMEKKLLSLMLLAVFSLIAAAAPREETVISPNGNIRIEVTIGDRLLYSVYYGEEQVLKDNAKVVDQRNKFF